MVAVAEDVWVGVIVVAERVSVRAIGAFRVHERFQPIDVVAVDAAGLEDFHQFVVELAVSVREGNANDGPLG